MKDPSSVHNALERYITRDDSVYHWSVKQEKAQKEVVIHDILLTSQIWRNNRWTHHLSIITPPEINDSQYALLFIAGGENVDTQPLWNAEEGNMLYLVSQIARITGSPVAILRQVPNQPLFENLHEDALVSFTFRQFLNTKDETWPLLFPMVKSAVKAMDTVQEFCQETFGKHINRFVVSGASKRGWTSWLTAAIDNRVKAIAPMVFEILNMNIQLKYQIDTWGTFSEELHDYECMGIPKKLHSDEELALRMMVDPYEYRQRLCMPKMIFIGTNDPYWPVDAIKHYLDDIPGHNFIHYIPNVGHDLGDGKQAALALGAFFATCAANRKHPGLQWSITEKNGEVKIRITGDFSIQGAKLWSAFSADRDFRDDQWLGASCNEEGLSAFTVTVALPEDGYRAFFVDCMYPSPLGNTYSKSTRMFVLNNKGIID